MRSGQQGARKDLFTPPALNRTCAIAYLACVLTHSFASRFGKNFFGSAVLDENGFASGGPWERFRILVSMLNPFVDCGLDFSDVVENASPYTVSGNFGIGQGCG